MTTRKIARIDLYNKKKKLEMTMTTRKKEAKNNLDNEEKRSKK